MNNFELIKAVRARKPLWDKSTWDKVDVVAREELWNEVATRMDVPKDIIKARWKNLRDSYRKILRKMSITEYMNPKWPFFKAMEFLKEITLNIKPRNMDITLRKSETQIEADYSLTLLSPSVDDDGPIDPISFAQKLNRQQTQYQQTSSSRGTKRSIDDDDTSVDILELENSCGTAEALLSKQEGERQLSPRATLPDDDDYQFLLSLYPHLRLVSPKRKLMLRMKIEQLLYNELYVSSSTGTQTSCPRETNGKGK
ncbi:hypothetical protein Trydic_g21876 [Trypoxylus dichotomus]